MKKKLCIIALSFLVICYLFASNALAEKWRLFLIAKGQGQQPSNVAIGVEDCDTCIWDAAPLMPEYAARIRILGKYGEELKLPSSAIEEWNLEVTVGVPEELPLPGDPNDPNQPFPGGDSGSVADASDPNFFPLLSWDPNEIGAAEFIELRLGDANGTVLVPDMKTTNSYQTLEEEAVETGYYDEPNSRALMRYTVTFNSGEKQEIPLRMGWNLIGFQINRCYYQETSPSVFLPEGVIMQDVGNLVDWLSNDTNSPLRDNSDPNKAGNWKRIISFDHEMGYLTGHLMDKDFDPRFNNLKYISAGYGYWIRMNAPGVLILEGPFLSNDTPLELESGWNLIGYIPHDTCYGEIAQGSLHPFSNGVYPSEDNIGYCQVDPVVPFVFTSISGQLKRTISFDYEMGYLTGHLWDKDFDPRFNNVRYIGPKYGYWIRIDDPAGATLIFPEDCNGTQ